MLEDTTAVAATAAMQLGFLIINKADDRDAENVIYITSDSSYNQATLQIQLSSGSTTLSPGEIPDPASPPVSGTTIYVDLSALQMSADTWTRLDFSAPDWQFQKFPGQGVFGMTPLRPIPLASGTAGVVNVAIDGITVPAPLASPQVQLYTEYYNVPGVAGSYGAFAVALQNKPSGQLDLSTVLSVALSANGIVNSPTATLTARNLFGLQFANRQQTQVLAGPDTVFTVGFVYGAPQDRYGFGALTDAANGTLIQATAGQNAQAWEITQNTQAQSPCWTLQPPDGAPIVGLGPQSIVQVNFSNVVTTYQPGATAMLIAYANVPGYRDGTFMLILNKVAHAQIGSLQVTPNPAVFSNGSAQVQVSWTTNGAQSLTLTQAYAITPVTGKTQIDATLDAESTAFLLTATGAAGTVENVDRRTVDAIALPVVNAFSAMPADIYAGSLSHDARFNWAVDSSDGVTITSTGPAFEGQSFPRVSGTTVSVTQPQMVSLAPTTAQNPLSLTRRIVISAFDPQARIHALSSPPSVVAASPTGPYLLAGGGTVAGLSVLDTIQYSVVGSVATNRVAQALVFSPDGGTVAVLNADKTVSVFSATLGIDGLPQFGAPSVVTLPGAGQAIAYSPNGPRLFITVAGASSQSNGQLVSLLGGANGFQFEASVPVGLQPAGLTLDAAGARVFVANQGDDTLSMIGLTNSGAPGGVTLVQSVRGGPTALAAAPGGQQLLVSCKSTGTVVAIDPDHPNTGQRKTLNVGSAPGAIGIIPNGAYAFVANGGDGTLSLIDCWGLPSTAAVLGTVAGVGAAPAGLAVSPDGQQVLVAAAGGLGVVTLATYQASTQTPPSLPIHPTSVEACASGTAVAAWHDASLPATTPSPGILVYGLQSGQTRSLLANKPVLRCVSSPDPLAHLAFAIVQGDPTLYAIDTQTLDVSPLTISAGAGAAPVALAVSGDGNTVWMVCADAAHALSLVVFQGGAAVSAIGWKQTLQVALYTATSARRILLRATPDGASLFLVNVDAAQVRVIRARGASYVLDPKIIQGDVKAQDLAVSPDGRSVCVLNAGTQNNTVTVIDTATLQSRIAAIPQPYVNLTGLQYSPDGRRLFATDINAAALRVLEPASLRIVQTLPLAANLGQAQGASGLSVAPDGSAIYTANLVSQTLGAVEQIQMGATPSTRAAGAFGRSAALMSRLAALAHLEGGVGDVSSALFMRHSLGETPTSPATGWSSSPDVIPYGPNIAPDLSIFTTDSGYAKDYVQQQIALNNPNYVYIRGLNTTNAAIKSRAYFYYTKGSMALWPANWSSANVTVNGQPQNWLDVPAPVKGGDSNGVGVAPLPLIWTPPSLDPGSDHYCVIAWVDNSANPQPPDFAHYSKFTTFDDLVNFISSHHNMAWRNTTEVTAIPPDNSYTNVIAMPAGGGQVMLSVTFPNVPLDGYFSVNVQGTGPDNSVYQPKSSLSQYQGGFTPRNNPLVFTSEFVTSIQVQHWPGATPMPDNAKIRVTMGVQTGPALMRDLERRHVRMGRPSPFRRWGGIPVFIVGTNTYNLSFGAQKTPAAR